MTPRWHAFLPCRHRLRCILTSPWPDRASTQCGQYHRLLGPQRYTPPPCWGLEKIGKWLVWTIWWCICKLWKNSTLSIYTTSGARSAPGVVYIQTAVFYHSLHIHHQIVHTSHFPIFSRPQPGGGVYLWGPNPTHIFSKTHVSPPKPTNVRLWLLSTELRSTTK